MKRIYFLFALPIVLIACKDALNLDQFTIFNMEFSENVTIQSSTGIDLPLNINTPDITTNSEASFANNNTRKDLIEDITLKQLKLTITTPSTGNFNFLKSVTLYIKADGLPEVKLASKEEVPNNDSNSLELDIIEANLSAYINQDKFSLRLSTVTDEFITEDHQIEIYSQFRVNAKVFGI